MFRFSGLCRSPDISLQVKRKRVVCLSSSLRHIVQDVERTGWRRSLRERAAELHWAQTGLLDQHWAHWLIFQRCLALPLFTPAVGPALWDTLPPRGTKLGLKWLALQGLNVEGPCGAKHCTIFTWFLWKREMITTWSDSRSLQRVQCKCTQVWNHREFKVHTNGQMCHTADDTC